MREFMIIFKQAFVTKAKTKSFVITTAIMLAAVFLFANMERIIDGVKIVTGGDSDSAQVLQVIDESGILVDRLTAQLEASGSDMTVEKASETEQVLTDQVKEGEIDSFLTVKLDEANTIQANYTSMSSMEFTLPMMIEDALRSIQTEMKAE